MLSKWQVRNDNQCGVHPFVLVLNNHRLSYEAQNSPGHEGDSAFLYQESAGETTVCEWDSPYLHFCQDFDVVRAEELLGAQGNLLWVGIH